MNIVPVKLLDFYIEQIPGVEFEVEGRFQLVLVFDFEKGPEELKLKHIFSNHIITNLMKLDGLQNSKSTINRLYRVGLHNKSIIAIGHMREDIWFNPFHENYGLMTEQQIEEKYTMQEVAE